MAPPQSTVYTPTVNLSSRTELRIDKSRLLTLRAFTFLWETLVKTHLQWSVYTFL